MSLQHPNILYVGDPENGRAFAQSVQSAGWWVHTPQDTLEALGMYVTYMPDLTVIDLSTQPDFTAEVSNHLRSIDACPLLILGGGRPAAGVYHDEPGSAPALLAHTIRLILDEEAEEKYVQQLLSVGG